MSIKDVEHVFERLRQGMVPERALETFAVGTEVTEKELHRLLELAARGEGTSKFLRGEYGCGKTFTSQLTTIKALQKNFAVSKVVVSTNDTPLYKFDIIYARIVGNLQTRIAKGFALGDCIDRWIANIEDRLIAEGTDEDSSSFDKIVAEKFEYELAEISHEEAGAEFVSVLRSYFQLKQQNDIPSAIQLLNWLCGSKNVAAKIKRTAGIKGEITSQMAMTFLKGVLLIIKKAGHPGLFVVLDEVETILRMRADIREKSLNAIRQILDAVPEYRGMFWLFTGTPDFFDSAKGVPSLTPLNDRIYFRKSGNFINVKQPQLELHPFNKTRLIEVAKKLRAIYPSEYKSRIITRVSDIFIEKLVNQVTKGFGGEIKVIPRQFLRKLADVLDLVDQHKDYDPMEECEIKLDNIAPPEQAAMDEIGKIEF